jgi:hypothetical protein
MIFRTITLSGVALLVGCNPPAIQTSLDVDTLARGTIKTTVTLVAESNIPKAPLDLTQISNMDLAEFGCWMETHLQHRDSVFNCALSGYVNDGDPCDNTAEYYRGVPMPENLPSRIHPLIKNLIVDFERGKVREITVLLSVPLSVNEIRSAFGMDPANPPSNVMVIDFYEDENGKSDQISIIGFEHMGSGDIDC